MPQLSDTWAHYPSGFYGPAADECRGSDVGLPGWLSADVMYLDVRSTPYMNSAFVMGYNKSMCT